MPLTTMYITNRPEIAQIAENHSVDRIWVDLELQGKHQRQPNMNTVISNHTLDDVSLIRSSINKAQLLVRVNALHENSKEEIDEVVSRGADIIMLPMYENTDDVKRFFDLVDGRAKTLLLLETLGAERCLDEVLELPQTEEIHIGLNDLHLQYKMNFMFQLLANGKVDEICSKIKNAGKKYGFGGIAQLNEGLLPAKRIIAEHYRLGSSMVILSRSFLNCDINTGLQFAEAEFSSGMQEIRDYEKYVACQPPEFFQENRKKVIKIVDNITGKPLI